MIKYRWPLYSLAILALSLIAVHIRLSGYNYVPHPLGRALDDFQSPGEIVWWLTLGHVFQGYPNTLPGYTVLIAANTVFWVSVTALVTWLTALVLKVTRGLRAKER